MYSYPCKVRGASSRVSFLIIFEYVLGTFRYRINGVACLIDQVYPLDTSLAGKSSLIRVVLKYFGITLPAEQMPRVSAQGDGTTEATRYPLTNLSDRASLWDHPGQGNFCWRILGRFGLHVTVHRWRFPSKLSINLMFNVWMSRIACFFASGYFQHVVAFSCWYMSRWHDTATLHVPDNILDSKLELPAGTEQVHSLTYLRDIGLKYFDLAVLVTDGRWSQGDIQLMNAIRAAEIPFLIARTKAGFEGDVCNAKLLIDLVSFRVPGHHLIIINNLQ